MIHRLTAERRHLLEFVRRNSRELLIVSIATLSMILFRYHSLGSLVLRYSLFFMVIPGAALLVLRRNPRDMGMGLGDHRAGLTHVLVGGSLSILVVAIGSRIGSVAEFYAPRHEMGVLRLVLERALIIFAIEFLFRGFLLFGLKDRIGSVAILVQMVPFALMHIGKPEIEAAGCILTGVYLGYVAYRVGSLWPAFAIHLIANIAIRLLNAPPA